MTTLIVTLPRAPLQPEALYDYVLSSDGLTADAHARVPLNRLPLADQRGDSVVAVVDSRHLSWHQVQLPRGTLGRHFFQEGGAVRLRAVLEGLLEEHLLDEPALLHFALQPQARTETAIWVAVCDRVWLRDALQALQRSGRPVQRVVPQFAPHTGDEAPLLQVVGEPDDAQLIFPVRGGIAAWPASAAAVALLQWPADQPIVAEPAVATLAEQLFARPVTLQHATRHALLAVQSPWDLAQFDLAGSGRAGVWKWVTAGLQNFARAPHWRAGRLALLALLLTNLLGVNALAWREQGRLAQQRQANQALLTSTFPQVRVVVDAPVQMAREVAALRQASGLATGADMESMLDALASAMPATQAPVVIDFAAGSLRLKGLQPAVDDIAALAFKLQGAGYVARAEGDVVLIQAGEGK